MSRKITWQRTGGKTYRVMVTDDEPASVNPYANIAWSVNSLTGLQNAANSPEWQAHMAEQARHCPNPPQGSYAAWGGPQTALFDGVLR